VPRERALVVPLSTLGAQDLAVAGGKGANLGELIRAGLSRSRRLRDHDDAYAAAASAASIDPTDPIAARARLMEMAVPPEVATAVRDAYRALGGRVAVRSSATAEDLPEASFAASRTRSSMSMARPRS